MAKSRKKSTRSSANASLFDDTNKPVVLSPQDERMLGKIYNLAANITAQAERDAEPVFAIPARSLGNVSFNKEKRVLQMGDKTTNRE
ncbi:MAG: hypothetical protein IK077_07220, partial [Thermoguttaceae bacterium]|nr:hypothetical protein [Thermoguttaceae bacterium]